MGTDLQGLVEKRLQAGRNRQRNYQNPVTDVQKRTAGYIAQYLKDE
jgi:hypothetical protein